MPKTNFFYLFWIVMILAICAGVWFYWYEVRPAQIAQLCAQEAKTAAEEFRKKAEDHSVDVGIFDRFLVNSGVKDQKAAITDAAEAHRKKVFTQCQEEHGIKNGLFE